VKRIGPEWGGVSKADPLPGNPGCRPDAPANGRQKSLGATEAARSYRDPAIVTAIRFDEYV